MKILKISHAKKFSCALIHSPQGREQAFSSSMCTDSNSKPAQLLLTACLLSHHFWCRTDVAFTWK